MELGDLLFYAILFGAWFLIFLTKKQPEPHASQEKKGLTLRLLEFIAEFKSSIEEQVDEQHAVSARDLPLSNENRGAPKNPSTNLPQSERHQASAIKTNIPKKVIQLRTNERDDNRLKIRHKFPKKKMKQAIIWAEILKPPIGLQ